MLVAALVGGPHPRPPTLALGACGGREPANPKQDLNNIESSRSPFPRVPGRPLVHHPDRKDEQLADCTPTVRAWIQTRVREFVVSDASHCTEEAQL